MISGRQIGSTDDIIEAVSYTHLDVYKRQDVSLHAMWARRHGTKFNGAPYIVQSAGEAVYSDAGKAQLKAQVAYYMNLSLIHILQPKLIAYILEICRAKNYVFVVIYSCLLYTSRCV